MLIKDTILFECAVDTFRNKLKKSTHSLKSSLCHKLHCAAKRSLTAQHVSHSGKGGLKWFHLTPFSNPEAPAVTSQQLTSSGVGVTLVAYICGPVLFVSENNFLMLPLLAACLFVLFNDAVLNSGNACCHSVQSLLSSRLLSRRLKLKYTIP
jgi:hypothetical protein